MIIDLYSKQCLLLQYTTVQPLFFLFVTNCKSFTSSFDHKTQHKVNISYQVLFMAIKRECGLFLCVYPIFVLAGVCNKRQNVLIFRDIFNLCIHRTISYQYLFYTNIVWFKLLKMSVDNFLTSLTSFCELFALF